MPRDLATGQSMQGVNQGPNLLDDLLGARR